MNQIHKELLKLVQVERETLNSILGHLQIIQEKKIYIELGYSSLLKYCINELSYSESAAYRRLKALKLLRAVPAIKAHLSSGTINLSQVVTAQKLFEAAKVKAPKIKERLIKTIENLSVQETEISLRQILKLPNKKYQIILEATEQVNSKWKELKQRMTHLRLNDYEIFDLLISEKLSKIKSCIAKPIRISKSKNQRYISKQKRDFLMKRANFKCEFIHKNKRCNSHFALEIDHIRPISQRGDSHITNLRVLCREHNQFTC